MNIHRLLGFPFAFSALLLFLPEQAHAAVAITYTVSSHADSGAGSLRQAILDANAHVSPSFSPDRIHFNLTPSAQNPFPVLQPTSLLPFVTDDVVIDGSTQPLTARVEVDLSEAGNAGLIVDDGAVTLRSLCLTESTADGLSLQSDETVQVLGCWIGLDLTGLRKGNEGDGIQITGPDNRIGGTGAGQQTVVSSNGENGIRILNATAVGNRIQNCLIGTDTTGLLARGNTADGVLIVNGPSDTIIGDPAPAGRNIIAANQDGIEIFNAASTEIVGNWIGLSSNGLALGNLQDGVEAELASFTAVGGFEAGAGNVVGANQRGILIFRSSQCRMQGNLIGLDPTGLQPRGHSGEGLFLSIGSSNPLPSLIGGSVPGARNVVCHNSIGIVVQGSAEVVQGNWVGLNVSGEAAGNTDCGVEIIGSLLGGSAPGSGNVISGNDGNGVLTGARTTVQGNFIGTDPTGTQPRSNAGSGVFVNGRDCQIGGASSGEGNLISANGEHGVEIRSGRFNVVEGNRIGTNAAGTGGLANELFGIAVRPADSRIGGSAAGQGNLISANHGGILISPEAQTTAVEGNLIGTGPTGGTELANSGPGILILGDRNRVGGSAAGARNVIAGNNFEGVRIEGSSNEVFGNSIGVGVGLQPLPNHRGIGFANGAAGNRIGGPASGEPNLIAHNETQGVFLEENAGSGNTIRHNVLRNNGGLGIDLFPVGPNPRDNHDVDSGPNDLQNSPVVGLALSRPGTVEFVISLSSAPLLTYTLDFYANTTTDGPDDTEGEIHLGEATLTLSIDGVAVQTFLFPSLLDRPHLTVLATLNGSTSEFSNARQALFPTAETIEFKLLGLSLDAPRFSHDFNDDGVVNIADVVRRVNAGP